MNKYDMICYEKTYNDSLYWEDVEVSTKKERSENWTECRCLTDRFFDELVARGYLVPRSQHKS
ncbi:hypothetical protein [Gloeothece verrucosa]|uniref:Uncharacterized protein n=1 Tax=Gloeothece verrucosa (strain PCC 7822) TaxID=497965 RepID=E0UB09_GLOV7|nr:hypothetical protein [Gloeothece verrucosa]ADN15131.1 hypothetical protein Cyan7822_3177 [Gloeothece verrucosa PCC 7822]